MSVDINSLTLGQIKEIAAIAGSIGIKPVEVPVMVPVMVMVMVMVMVTTNKVITQQGRCN